MKWKSLRIGLSSAVCVLAILSVRGIDGIALADYALTDPLRELAPEVVNAQSTPRIFEWLDRIAERPATRAERARSRRADPRTAYVPGVEPSRWG